MGTRTMILPIMPWCRIDRAYDVGDITIIPYLGQIEDVDELVQRALARVLSTYRDIQGRPVDHAAVVRYVGKGFGSDLSDDEIEAAYEWVQLACFAGLAGRQFFTPEAPGNSDAFILYVQRLQDADFVALRTRRREGHTWSAWPLDAIVLTVPTHVSPVRSVSLDARLLDGLMAFSVKRTLDWGRWQHALSCFNQANTDGDTFGHQVEWGLMCSAFEQLLGADSKAEDVADRFAKTVVPSRPLLAPDAQRRLERWKDAAAPVRYEWLKEFYRVRGDFAHGRLTTRQPMAWHPIEHLTLAAIAFPLLVRLLLQSAGTYRLTADDVAAIEVFEKFADQSDFLQLPPDTRNSLDTWWARFLGRGKCG
jgi:hypothetical protein